MEARSNMRATGRSSGSHRIVAGKGGSSLPSGKEFIKEFFEDPQDRPKKCDNKKVQCGLKGNPPGSTPLPENPSGGPSGGPGGGGGGGAGPGAAAAAASAALSSANKERVMKFRKEIGMNTKTAAPPKEMGSTPAGLQSLAREEMDAVEVDPAEVEEVVMDEPAEPSGCGCPSGGPVEPPEMDAPPVDQEDEEKEGVYAALNRLADDMGDEEESAMEVGESDIEAMGDEPEAVGMESEEEMGEPSNSSDCVCVPSDELDSDIPEVGEEEVQFLSDDDEEEGEEEEQAKAEAMYASARRACQQRAKSDEPSAPSHSPSEEKAPWKDPSSQKEAAAELVEMLTPIETLGEVDINDVELNLFNEESENPHYTVMVKGEPVAKIALQDQTLPQDQHDLFLQQDYPQFVLEGIEQFGLPDTLQSVHARYYAAGAMEGAVAAEMKKAAIADMESHTKRHIAKVKDDLGNVAALVIEGSLKNYIVENPLRDALVQQFRSAGVDADAAVDLVENAFREAGAQYFTMILNKAEEWMGAPKEAMEHHIKEITGMNYRHPGYSVADAEDEITEAVEPEPMISTASVPKSIPIRTTTPQTQTQTRTADAQLTGNWQADKDAWKRRLNLFGHVASKSLANTDKFRK